ncbi:hypothetical protein Back11_54090 [Paenibacillus baekrokdamisoli]|uniref:Uncharacterized protein n=1 Tax=Paenibacillus baekrokdamisoli TaxID=1712516 RepID=A0A3G9JMG2_9BACL|nr:hypothetical protein [Paenibacillus baekrokdamisoli]BBH24064.1 hypothetical protein Back11_54090 [Paenibacillus baekrokdamisoli]
MSTSLFASFISRFTCFGVGHLSRLNGEFSERETNAERKEAMEKRQALINSSAWINAMHLYSARDNIVKHPQLKQQLPQRTCLSIHPHKVVLKSKLRLKTERLCYEGKVRNKGVVRAGT